MKKVSLLVGTLGGALAGYLFSNKKLREEIMKAKDAQHAAKILGQHLSTDGGKLAKDVKVFVESDTVQDSLTSAKKYAQAQYKTAKREVEKLVQSSMPSKPIKRKKK
jgi:hypothetical protein